MNILSTYINNNNNKHNNDILTIEIKRIGITVNQ